METLCKRLGINEKERIETQVLKRFGLLVETFYSELYQGFMTGVIDSRDHYSLTLYGPSKSKEEIRKVALVQILNNELSKL